MPDALFHGDGAGKDDVVFKVDVVVKAFFEKFQSFHEEPVGGAAVVGGGVSVGQAVDFTPACSAIMTAIGLLMVPQWNEPGRNPRARDCVIS